VTQETQGAAHQEKEAKVLLLKLWIDLSKKVHYTEPFKMLFIATVLIEIWDLKGWRLK